MPFALVFTGLILIITGFQNTYKQFGAQVAGDFTGPNNFLYWIVAIGLVGSLGYAKGLETFSRAFMILVLFIMVIVSYKRNPGIFSDIGNAIASGSATPDTTIGAPLAGGGGGSGSGGGGSDGLGSDLSSLSSAIDVSSAIASVIAL